MLIMLSFKKGLIEEFQGNYLKLGSRAQTQFSVKKSISAAKKKALSVRIWQFK